MAEQYDDTNRFALFKQDKGDNPSRPDYTGTINVEGKEFRLAAWIRESKNGLKYLSGNVDKTIEQKLAEAPGEPSALDTADEVPF
jgi:uncharacterized protein (DUF736 family)